MRHPRLKRQGPEPPRRHSRKQPFRLNCRWWQMKSHGRWLRQSYRPVVVGSNMRCFVLFFDPSSSSCLAGFALRGIETSFSRIAGPLSRSLRCPLAQIWRFRLISFTSRNLEPRALLFCNCKAHVESSVLQFWTEVYQVVPCHDARMWSKRLRSETKD